MRLFAQLDLTQFEPRVAAQDFKANGLPSVGFFFGLEGFSRSPFRL